MHGCEATTTVVLKSVRVLSRVGLVKTRKAFVYSLGGLRDNVFFYNNSVSVVVRALTERLYLVRGRMGFVPCPKPTASFSTLAYFRKAVKRGIRALPPAWTAEEFVYSYAGAVQRRYASALRTYSMRGVRRSDGYLSTFIKAELYNGTNKNNPCPRLIQPRSPVYNIAIGRFLRPVEKLIYKSIDRVFQHHVVLKCDNMWKRASTITQYWGEFRNPCFVGLDASRFDQHVSAEALEFEHSLYNGLFNDPELAEYLTWQIDQKGYANMVDGTVKYTVTGCRASGDMNTALGNVFLMCAITHNYLRQMGCKYRFINDGDDCGVFLEREHLHLLAGLPAHHLQFGFEMEVEEPAFEIEHIEFCQCRPVQLREDQWMMVRNIHKCMKHDWVVLTTRDWATTEEVLVATGRCGLSLYAGVPILSEMYAAMLRFPCRPHVVQKLLDQAFHGPRTWRQFASSNRPFEVDETLARVSIYKAFGILPDQQVAHEAAYRAFSSGNIETSTRDIFPLSTDKSQYIFQN